MSNLWCRGAIHIAMTWHVLNAKRTLTFADFMNSNRKFNVSLYLTQRILLPSTVGIWWVKALKERKYPVAIVSVRFRSKERGTRVKDRAKNDTSKRAERGWGRKEGNVPLPLPPLIFWLSFHFSRGQNRSFFAPTPNGNACYAGYGFRFPFLTSWTWSIFPVEVNVLVA